MLVEWNKRANWRRDNLNFESVDSRPCKKRKGGAPDVPVTEEKSKAGPPAAGKTMGAPFFAVFAKGGSRNVSIAERSSQGSCRGKQ